MEVGRSPLWERDDLRVGLRPPRQRQVTSPRGAQPKLPVSVFAVSKLGGRVSPPLSAPRRPSSQGGGCSGGPGLRPGGQGLPGLLGNPRPGGWGWVWTGLGHRQPTPASTSGLGGQGQAWACQHPCAPSPGAGTRGSVGVQGGPQLRRVVGLRGHRSPPCPALPGAHTALQPAQGQENGGHKCLQIVGAWGGPGGGPAGTE